MRLPRSYTSPLPRAPPIPNPALPTEGKTAYPCAVAKNFSIPGSTFSNSAIAFATSCWAWSVPAAASPSIAATTQRRAKRARLLGVDTAHPALGVAAAGRRPLGRDLADALQVARGQHDLHGAGVLLEVAPPLGAGDRYDILALRQQPGEGELRRSAALLPRDRFHPRHQVEVSLEVLPLKARVVAAPVVRGEVLEAADLPGDEPAPERAVGHEPDPELAARGQDLVLGVARPQRILGLQRADRVHGVRAAQRRRRRFGEPQVAHLARSHERCHGAHRVLYRDGAIHAMLIVQIYVVDAQPLEGGVTGLVDVLRPPIDAQPSAVRATHVAELRGQDHPVAAAPDRPAHELLVGEWAVHVRGVEKRDTELERAVNRRDRLRVVAGAVELRHPHAPEAQSGHHQPLGAKLPLLHPSVILHPSVVSCCIQSAVLQHRTQGPSSGSAHHARGLDSMTTTTLPTRPLGTNGLEITTVGFGAWAIGGGGWSFGWGPQDDTASLAAMRDAVERGINWIDTAAVSGLRR